MSTGLQAAHPGGTSKQRQLMKAVPESSSSLAGTGGSQPAVLLLLPLSQRLPGGKKGHEPKVYLPSPGRASWVSLGQDSLHIEGLKVHTHTLG